MVAQYAMVLQKWERGKERKSKKKEEDKDMESGINQIHTILPPLIVHLRRIDFKIYSLLLDTSKFRYQNHRISNYKVSKYTANKVHKIQIQFIILHCQCQI